MPERFDLHTHSALSDGTTSPSDIAHEAREVGLAGFALTDHDSIAGWDEARDAAHAVGLEFLPGMEVTTQHGYRSTHLLAYGLDLSRGGLARALTRVRESRVRRAEEMVRLLSDDFDIDWETVFGSPEEGAEGEREPATRVVGRPHIADALVEGGYFSDRSAAFASVLRPGSPYYLPTYAIETTGAISMVREAGGVPVLAHPAAGRHSHPLDPSALKRFVDAGLWGIELDHPENRTEWLPELEDLAHRFGLQVTGASDYHGEGKPNRLGERSSDRALWEAIRSEAAIPQ